MIDHLLGRPSGAFKRIQVLLVLIFWIWRLRNGNSNGPKLFNRINNACKRFTPWQITVALLTTVYAGKNLDSILGLGSPEPLAHLYSRSYYRATWLITGLDAGFATAMSIQPKWLRDICSMLFSAYYIVYANQGDEKLRKFRAICTVEMLRITWEKTTNPYIRLANFWDRPRVSIVKKILLPRPPSSPKRKPIVAWLFFNGSETELSQATELILDLPGGGFICLTPRHHEERIRRWTIRSKRPVLSIDYGKAPEYPFPYAIDECFDVYRTLVETKGTCIGMSGSKLGIIMSGDSAGGNLVTTVMYKILECAEPIPRPLALVLCYPALDFNFTSWMSPAHLRVLRSEQSTSNLAGLAEQKDHYSHKSPLAVINDTPDMRRRKSWTATLSLNSKDRVTSKKSISPTLERTRSFFKRKSNPFSTAMGGDADEAGNAADDEDIDEDHTHHTVPERDKPIAKRVVFSEEEQHAQQVELSEAVAEALIRERNTKKVPIGTRLTMTSRTGYFQDRILSPSMMRAMAILYIGPKRNPDFQTNYYLSPILGPNVLLAQFPPMLMICGEKDPLVDDTVIFAGRVREAKTARKQELQASCRRNGRTGEAFRMTDSLSKEDERILNETDEDWVRMAIVEGWGHGFLQMSTLMPEARDAINGISDWINEAFTSHAARISTPHATRKPSGHELHVEVAASSETETDEGLTFVPKKKRSPPSSFRRSQDVPGDDRASIWPLRSSDGTPIGARTDSSTRYEPGSSVSNPRDRVGLREPSKPLVASTEVVGVTSSTLITGVGTAGGLQRPGTPGKVAPLVSEADLLKRRRQEAVFGIGDIRSVE